MSNIEGEHQNQPLDLRGKLRLDLETLQILIHRAPSDAVANYFRLAYGQTKLRLELLGTKTGKV